MLLPSSAAPLLLLFSNVSILGGMWKQTVKRLRPGFPPLRTIDDPHMRTRLSFDDFLATPPGERLREWEAAQFDELVADVFGVAALQIGAPQLNTLRANRIQGRWILLEEKDSLFGLRPELHALRGETEALPVAAESLDLVTLPHTLDFAEHPQQVLRDAVRALAPEGRLVLTAFNALGAWWLKERLTAAFGGKAYLPTRLQPISLGRLKDWLALLGMEVDRGRFGIYSPGVRSSAALRRWAWLDKAGDRWAPQFSNLILLSAVKRQPGTRLIDCATRPLSERRSVSTFPVAPSHRRSPEA